MNNGENKRNFKQIFYKLGVIKYSNEDSNYPSCCESNKQSCSIFYVKSIFYGLLIFYTLFSFTNKVSAYSLNNYSDLPNLEYCSLSDLDITSFSTTSTIRNFITNSDNKVIAFITSYNDIDYLCVFGLNSAAIDYDLILADTSSVSTMSFNLGTISSMSNCLKCYIRHSSGSPLEDTDDISLTLNDTDYLFRTFKVRDIDSSVLFDIKDNKVYTNLSNFKYLYNNQILDIDLSNINQPSESDDTLDSSDETTSVDLSFTNNLLFYIAFIMTLGVLYTMIRNTFKRGW